MNKEQALQKVETLSRKIATGETSLEQWKWQRAEAMAQAADAGATQREIARRAGGIDQAEVSRHVRVWRDAGTASPRPDWKTAFDNATGFDRDAAQERTDRARTKRILATAPLEQVEQIIAGLPKERQQAVAAAAGHEYLKARQEYAETEHALTPGQQRERDEAQEQITRATRKATADFTTLGIIGHLEQATDELRELNADSSVTPEMARKIDRALDAFTTEFRFARAMLGEEIE